MLLVRAVFEVLWLAASAAMALFAVSSQHRFDVVAALRLSHPTGPFTMVSGWMVASVVALAIAGVRYAWILPAVSVRRGNARLFAVAMAAAAAIAAAQCATAAQNLMPLEFDDRRELVRQLLDWGRLSAAAFLLLALECTAAVLRTAWLGWMGGPTVSPTAPAD